MKKDVKVSVIIPVYNVEKYLPKCLDSMVNQTLKDIEIIVVNDGSPDNSEKIIKEYLKKDKRIIYLKKENGGQGSARNLGIKKAKGEFLCFVDSDDYIELNMLELLYDKAINEESDIVISNYNKVIGNNKQECSFFDTLGQNNIESYILNMGSPWGKIIRKDIITNNNLFFPEGIIYEDYAVVPLYALFANKISYVDIPLYNYLIREGSTMTQKFNEKFYDIISATDYLYKRLEEYGFPYYQEYEYFIIKNIFREAYIRLLPYPNGTKVLDKINIWAKGHIPNWYKNKYFKKENFKSRLFTYLIYKRQYKLLSLIHKIKKVLK